MKFCPRCGTVMVPKRKSGKIVFTCPNCGYVLEPQGRKDLAYYSRREVIKHSEKEKTVVISERDLAEGLPVTKEAVCPRCGNRGAYYWFVQTRAADEPPTRFFKCTKCGYVWREYD